MTARPDHQTTPVSRLNIWVVIPVYNHGSTVFDVIRQCCRIHDQVLVVDDGSTDLDADQIKTGKEGTIHWLHHDRNRGKGAAILTAAAFVRQQGGTHIITIDADLQHDPSEISKFIDAITQDPSALFVGKRDFSSSGIPGASKFGRRFSNFWYRVETGHRIGDSQSGFRAYPLFLFDELKLSQNHYAFEVEILVKSAWGGVPVKDVDISVHYQPVGRRVSHFRLFMDNLRLTHLNALLTLRSFIPIPHKKILPDSFLSDDRISFSIFRPIKSIRLFLAQDLSPFQIAMAGGVGVVLGALPLIAVHTLAILFVTGFFRLNKLMALAASQLCMPPLVPAACIEVGYFLTHQGTFLVDISFETLGREAGLRLYEWLIGSIILAPVLGGIVFTVIYLMAIMILKVEKQHG